MQQQPRRERGVEWPRTSADLTRRIRETRSAYEALVVRQLESLSEPRRRMLVGAPTVDVSAVRGVLRNDEAIVEYYPTADTLIVFVLTREHVRALRVPASSDDVEQRIRLVRGLIGLPGHGVASRPVLEALHARLVQPLVERRMLDGVRRLLLVPHGALAYLPYPALRDPKTGHSLAQDYVLERLPAAAVLPALRTDDGQASREIRAAVFTPFPDRLPAAQAEAKSAARLAPNAPIYRGATATEAQLRHELAERGLVHIASHAAFNSANPMFSGIELARGHGEPTDDGRLELHEVLSLPVHSRLVFLSGCETGLGAARATVFDRPEDAATLSDAFLLSGAGGVVATLWRIDDEGGAYLAERFYRHLEQHEPADALVLAQRDLIGHPRWGDPYYWAAYSLNGDGLLSARD
jgi:CHAT domain-containing protein